MPRRGWSGRRATRARLHVINRDAGLCWLCGHHGATSLDHINPASTHPHLEWEPTNWRAAHLTKAGTDHGCTTPGCHCIGNKGRKATPITAPPSRNW
jgi:hypothetical protein